jgi:hypothetical protein
MVRPAPSSDSVLMGHRMVRQLDRSMPVQGRVFLKDLLGRICYDQELHLVAIEAEILLVSGQYAVFGMVSSV